MTKVCKVRGCGGTLELSHTLTQDGTGEKSHIYECTRKKSHVWWFVEATQALLQLHPVRRCGFCGKPACYGQCRNAAVGGRQ